MTPDELKKYLESAHQRLVNWFSRLKAGEPYRVIFPPDPRFNCIAHAAGVNDQWWWPLPYPPPPGVFWPAQVPRVESIDAFVLAFATMGYAKGANDGLEPTREKSPSMRNMANRRTRRASWTTAYGPVRSEYGKSLNIRSSA